MQCYRPTELPQTVREIEALSWSEDQRLAVTSSEKIYIFTLKGRGSTSNSLPASISTASDLPYRQNPPLSAPAGHYDPTNLNLDLSFYLDHGQVPGHTPTANCESGWSPAGCDVIGGCLLTVLAVSGQLWLLTPPGSHTTKWHVSTSLNHPSGVIRCKTFHWLPHIIPANNGMGGAAVIAMATKKIIRVMAVEVPISRNREPEFHQLWESEVKGEGWPCRLRWSLTPSLNSEVHLAVGMTEGQLFVLSWKLPGEWGGATQWAEPELREVWPKQDGMLVRHIAWQQSSPPVVAADPWLVFSKVSTLFAVKFSSSDQSNNGMAHTTIYGVHSRAVTGLASLPGHSFISCALDGSVQRFSLGEQSHAIPSPVVVRSVTGDCRAQGLAISHHGLFLSLLTSDSSSSSSTRQMSSHLHLSPLLSLSQLNLTNNIDLSWDIAEAIWLHSVSKQLLPGNLPVLVSSRWPHLSHMLEILCDDRRGDGGGCEGEDGAGVLMEHVLEVLGGSSVEGVVRGDGAEPESGGVARRSLRIMCQWVESGRLAPPLQQEAARMVLSELQNGMETETCAICQTSIPFTNHRREVCANGHSWERCCVTLLLATSALCGRCRGCGSISHNLLSLDSTTCGSWFKQLLARGKCTYCHSHFDLII